MEERRNICVYGAASNDIDQKYLDECERLGSLMAKRGFGLVFGGGDTGVMGATARGVRKAGGYIIGVAPSFFKVEGVLYPYCDEFLYPDTMRERKHVLEERASAFIAAPGGIGTFDEFFEIISLRQLGRHVKAVVLLDLFGYYEPLTAMIENAVKQKFAGNNMHELFKVAKTCEEALDYIESYVPFDIRLRKSVSKD